MSEKSPIAFVQMGVEVTAITEAGERLLKSNLLRQYNIHAALGLNLESDNLTIDFTDEGAASQAARFLNTLATLTQENIDMTLDLQKIVPSDGPLLFQQLEASLRR